MKLVDSILLSASVGFLVIGINQVFAGQGKESYWIFMFSIICLFSYQARKLKRKEKAAVAEQTPNKTTGTKPKKDASNSNYTKKKKRRK
ncbi:hypothetical protein [Microscilla marina]|uniref:Uncharacterized protein n=1 Tax=Microscilla marina ATCC 23134 TaxID=313606 RepID=A1ZG73_MICM2|nr:hypothetical protein [Microscilla marina]EAY30490.1 hypothetical protein M23134_03126 [Microscilla marina ATCC 23134]